jgi:DNA polymerase elongation subunit (family B)
MFGRLRAAFLFVKGLLPMLIIDTECYKNYFLASFRNMKTRQVANVELYEGKPLNTKQLRALMGQYTTISFNGNGYDLPMLVAAIEGYNNEQLKALSDKIITSGEPVWRIIRDANLHAPASWDHIDIMQVAPGQSGLKIYGGRLHAIKMQDLPIAPSQRITPADRDSLRTYCANDLDTTELLYKALEKQIDLRKTMSDQYGMDLRSKSDAQIAETVITSELRNLTGKTYRSPKLEKGYSFRYQDPGIVMFKSHQLNSVFERILNTNFTLATSGAVAMPEWLKAERIELAGVRYQMGIGGLHSVEKSQHIEKNDDYLLFELDVAAFYPNIILQQKLAPKSLGEPFLKVYESIVNRRIAAKRKGDKVADATLKIAINGSFGKLGSKYSALYSPDLLIQTTITGQLALLMLIERMEAAGISVKSANTDGIVIHCNKSKEREMETIAFDWMLGTTYELERTDYRSISSANVNNYCAVMVNGKTKGKGIFAPASLQKNPDAIIVSKAVCDFLATGADIEQTINQCNEMREFVTVRQVRGGAMYEGVAVGKAVRFYHSKAFALGAGLTYATNGNRVPKSAGCAPVMDLSESELSDIDRDYYVKAAKTLLKEVGHVGT